jgi:hypothetical protein
VYLPDKSEDNRQINLRGESDTAAFDFKIPFPAEEIFFLISEFSLNVAIGLFKGHPK